MRLIDADKLLKVIAEQERWNVSDFVYESIKNAPTIDAEPVVRCKDCEYYNGEDKYCVNDIFAKPDGYCMFGRRER